MHQSVFALFGENKPSKTSSVQGDYEFINLTKIVLGALLIIVVLTVAPMPASATSLEQQLAEIEEALPGNSYTKFSPALAVQSWEMAATIAHIQKPASCKTAKLIDTKVMAVQQKVVFTSARKLKQGRWSEVWTFDKCGKKIRVQAEFKADGRGTADGDFSLAK